MSIDGAVDITGLLMAWGDGNEDALGGLMPMVYSELRRIARKHLARGVPGHTLESGALVNEAYLKLIRAHGIRCEKPAVVLCPLRANHPPHCGGPCAQPALMPNGWRQPQRPTG